MRGKEDRMRGKTCVITGATSGIGKAAAFALAEMGASLVMVGRNAERGARIQRELRKRYPAGQLDFHRTDLSSLAEVRELAAAIVARHDRIDVLINNAGTRYDRYLESRDGFELTFATNHLGHFLLTCLLWDRLIATPTARVITVSSGAHASAKPDGLWLSQKHQYDRRQAYAKSKLANVLFAFELARRMVSTGVTSNAVHPGGVATNFARNNGLLSWLKHLVAHGMKGELRSPRKGAETIVYLARDNQAAGVSGRYFFQCRPVDPAPAALDSALAAALWNASVQWTKIDRSIGAAWKYVKPEPWPLRQSSAKVL
jgi:NAD(P)-dependent dehydrogenase (short-subunit alcohol dehydrogenase family)